MKSNLVTKWVGASALALSLAILPSALPAAAQVTPDPVDPTLSDDVAPDATYTDPAYEVEDDGFDWGWLGLLGLLGLAGLAGRNRDRTTTYRTDDRVVTPTSSDPRI
ncbi:hypothetical protein C7293_22455 [filamentous cyanobacterium CCT1]|nr:hypothetical protein C7293_22455 [filamentous cyanobacterium CCT1]PSN78739.1 hypothetical protein C8B47_15340 [filamentous cyanobacterium CCP4]